ncbi:ABC transporter permease, partial [Rhizobium sp. SEMIA 4085]
MSDTTQNAAVPSSKLFGSFSVRDTGTLIGLIAIVVLFGLLAPDFVSQRNLLNILQQSSINACLALGMTLVIISGGIDLSVGPTAAIAAVITATLLVAGIPVPLAILAGLGIGVICGLVNGVLVAYAGLQPFIVTLGTLSTYRAIALIYT